LKSIENSENPDEILKRKIEKYQEIDSKLEKTDKLYINDAAEDLEIKVEGKKHKPRMKADKTVINEPEGNLLNRKRKPEKAILSYKEIQEVINKKKEDRKKIFKQLNRKTHKGQPVMRNKIQYYLHKIKEKLKNNQI